LDKAPYNTGRFFRPGPVTAGLSIEQQLIELYAACDCHAEPVEALPALAAPEDFAHALALMVRDVWELEGMPDDINDYVTSHFAKVLWKGTETGYGTGIDYDTVDDEMINALKKNVYQFSAAKNYRQLKELSNAVIDEHGKVREWNDFKAKAYEINDKHVNQWLKAEYNLAVSSGQMAATWARIEKNKDTLPMLEFDAVMDRRTTELCSSLNGVVKPVDDKFWSKYYPPNHFNCRSDVRPHLEGRTETADSNIVYPDVPEMFQTNLAKNGLVFPPKHPYWDGCPKSVKQAGENLMPKK
jgi:SPP1 gp7 family putative phage head morphogenesis protein